MFASPNQLCQRDIKKSILLLEDAIIATGEEIEKQGWQQIECLA